MPNEEIHNLSVSQGNVFTEMETDILPKRHNRTRRRFTYPRAIEKRQAQNIVKRKRIFTSVGHASFGDDGVAAVADNGSLTINNVITDVNGALWLLVPEWSFFVDAVSDSNEYPNGTFFSSASARQNASNYDIISNVKEWSSTDPVIRWSIRFINRTGGTVNMGCVLGMRFVVNTDRSPTE